MVCQPPDSGQKWRCGTAAPGFACRPGGGAGGARATPHWGLTRCLCGAGSRRSKVKHSSPLIHRTSAPDGPPIGPAHRLPR